MDFPFSQLMTIASCLLALTLQRVFSMTHHYGVKNSYYFPPILLISRPKKATSLSLSSSILFPKLLATLVPLFDCCFPLSLWFWQSTTSPLAPFLPYAFLSFPLCNYELFLYLWLSIQEHASPLHMKITFRATE